MYFNETQTEDDPMPITPRTLTQMQNRPTSYEVAIEGEVVAYTAKKTKGALLDIAQKNGQKILDQLGDWDGEAVYRKGKWIFGPVTIAFTGRTEREAASAAGLI